MHDHAPMPSQHELAIPISAVLLTYGGHEQAAALLTDLLQAGVRNADVVIVDNPCEPRAYALSRLQAGAHIISLARNVGYGAAMNAGVRQLDHPQLVLLMTCDARIPPSSVHFLAEAALRYPTFGLLGPVLRHPQSRAVFSYGGVDPGHGYVYHRSITPGPEHEIASCDWLDGSCILARGALMLSGDPFDPQFFLYYEDVDWCQRVRAAGSQVGVAWRAEATQTSGTVTRPAAFAYFQARNGIKYARRVHGVTGTVKTLRATAARLRSHGRVSVGARVRGSRSMTDEAVVRALIRGTFDGLANRGGPPPRAPWASHIRAT
jgi:N-acetylglucosaminyl-diphospho-decaprenol L-rhamnosyltransferase